MLILILTYTKYKFVVFSMIDGVDSLNNVLVIGMTNRKDLIDRGRLFEIRLYIHIIIIHIYFEIFLVNDS